MATDNKEWKSFYNAWGEHLKGKNLTPDPGLE